MADHFDTEDGKNANPATNALATDPELEGLTLYEKKAVLVNRELDQQGMGRYQWVSKFPSQVAVRSCQCACHTSA